MSRTRIARPQVARMVALVVAVVAGGCANAGNGGDDPVRVDAAMARDATAPIDAAVAVDARVVIDAPSAPLDAPPGSLFCTANSQCTVAGECCLDLGGSMGFCTEGDIFLGECIPPL